ncbi:MAG: hypothetical protein PHO10_11230 [Gemmiger sp.]|nr:hypothetical protein [Gemmiger sp.]
MEDEKSCPVSSSHAQEMLELLAKRVGCEELSDLLKKEEQGKVFEALSCIGADDYPVSAWNEVSRYLIGREYTYQNGTFVKVEILHGLLQINRK